MNKILLDIMRYELNDHEYRKLSRWMITESYKYITKRERDAIHSRINGLTFKESAQILKKLDGSPVTTGVAYRIYCNAAYKLRPKMNEFLKTL